MSSGMAPMLACSSRSASEPAMTGGRLVQLKKAMNWLIISSISTMPPRPANVLVMALMTSALPFMVLAPDAVADARDQEGQHDDEQQAVHERRVADDVAGLGVAQRRAGQERDQHDDRDDDQEAERGPTGCPSCRASAVMAATSSAWAARRGSGCHGPSRGSTIRSVTSAATMAMMSDEAIMN